MTEHVYKIIIDSMDIDYKSVIDFSKLKAYLKSEGRSIVWLSDKCGVDRVALSQIVRNVAFPKTDLIAKIASALKVPVSQIVEFKLDADEKKMAWFKDKVLPYLPDGENKGEVTYKPLRILTDMYLDYINGLKDSDKTANDLYDLIEPYRRRNRIGAEVKREWIEKAMEARGYDAGYKSERTDRKYRAKGLTPLTRSKIKNDKPLNIRAIYDICNFFGCSVDWVMSYK